MKIHAIYRNTVRLPLNLEPAATAAAD